MGKTIIIPAVFSFGLLASLLVGVQTVKAPITPDGKGCPLFGNVNIMSPSNITYSFDLLTLNVTAKSLFGPSQYRFEMVYSIDGETKVTIPLTTTFMSIEALITYENGTTATATSVFSPYVTAGWVALSELPEGSHELTVYANYERTSTNQGLPARIWDSSTIHFTIDDGQPLVISDLSLENKTCSQNDLSFYFATDQPTSWIGYCLDEKTNVTIAENTTLTGLSDGSHSVIVYANDSAGNMDISESVVFTVDTPEPFPTTLVAPASGASVAVAGLDLLVYFKKRRNQARSH